MTHESTLARAYWSRPENRAEAIRIGMITETTTPSSLDPVEPAMYFAPTLGKVIFIEAMPPRAETVYDLVPALAPEKRAELLALIQHLEQRQGPLFDHAGVYVTHPDFLLPWLKRLLKGATL